MKIIHIDFDIMPDLNDFWKEQIGLGFGSLYLLKDNNYLMIQGSKCSCCNPNGQTIWKLTSTGKHIETLESWNDSDNIVDIYKFNIPERLTKNYFKF